jgi:ParB family transcriptional regulator, chromosome partitioning protein
MARRRLAPVDPTRIASAVDPARIDGSSGPHRAEADVAFLDVPRAERSGFAPIARVAADAAAGAALEEMAETLRAAREEGRLVLTLPLGDVAADHLARDRIPVEDEEMTALKESIRLHGQRAPIEVTALKGPLPYGLVSGWRRLAALKALHREAGDDRFATVRALVLRPENAEAAYVAMVEENEIRVGLSYYERARVAALATERGIFPSEQAALRALFATASRPKRSRIGAFVDLFRALDAHLRFPQAIPERLGLRLVERLREGQGAPIAAALDEAAPESAEAELALLHRLASNRAPRALARNQEAEIRPGIVLTVRRKGGSTTLILNGRGVTAELEVAIRALLARGVDVAHAEQQVRPSECDDPS